MRRTCLVLSAGCFVLSALCNSLAPVVLQAQQQRVNSVTREATAGLAGRTIDSTSGQPVAGATVTLRAIGRVDAAIDPEGRVAVISYPTAVSDASGWFNYDTLFPGAYTVMATTRTGFVQGTAYVEVGANQRITDVVVRVARFGSMAGTIRDEAGDPVVGMRVDALLKRMAGLRPILMPRGGGQTDDRGQFRIGDLPPGEYLVCACGRDPLPIDKGLLLLLGRGGVPVASLSQRLDSSVPTFAATFYPGRTRASEAVTVVVGSGDELAGVDIAMRGVTPRRVSGELRNLGTIASNQLTLTLVAENDRAEAHSVTNIDSVEVTPSGAFSFVAVPPGRYSLEVYPTDGKAGLWASVPVEVGERDVAGLEVMLGAGTEVTGRIEFSGRASRPDAGSMVLGHVGLVPADLTPRAMISAGTSGSIGHVGTLTPEGSFRIEGVPPGRYFVTATRLGPDWQLVESVRSGPSGTLDRIVMVAPTGLTHVIVTMSDAATAMLLGTIALEKYEAPQSVRILLFPTEPATWAEPLRSVDRFVIAPVGNTRTFRFSGVPAGDYFVVPFGVDGYIGPEQLELWARIATRVTLRGGETTKVGISR